MLKVYSGSIPLGTSKKQKTQAEKRRKSLGHKKTKVFLLEFVALSFPPTQSGLT
jgi:hypothetical protein